MGSKTAEWKRDRVRLIKEAILSGRIEIVGNIIMGRCEDCGEWKQLDPDHRKKRSQGGSNDKKNIDWVCRKDHNFRDNMGDPKNKKIKTKKADWAVEHQCLKCKKTTRQLICDHCGELSVKA